MAKHGSSIISGISAASIREEMERRFSYLHSHDLYNGEHAGEYAVLESILSDFVEEESPGLESVLSVGDFASSTDGVRGLADGERLGGSRADSGAAPSSPRLLTGGFPSTESSFSPSDVPEFSHGGYDGGVVVGFDGTWNPLRFSRLCEILDKAKELAGESAREEGLEGFPLNLDGVEVLVSPKGGLAGGEEAKGGVVYKYRFFCQGVEFLIHSKPSNHIQPVRIRYGAESVQGHRDRFYEVHFGFVLPFLKKLGLVVHADKLSRVDMQCLIDVPVGDFVRLFQDGHVVTKLRKKSVHGTMTRDDTITVGSKNNVQFCIYDKGRELRSQKSSLVKEALFVRDCVGDEWYNSRRPITRVEVRLGRDALKSLGINSVSDLQQSERGVVDLLTTEWLRILAQPKVRGHEGHAALHPIWERVRQLFFSYFSGNDVPVKWEKRESLVCNSAALERQALGCLSKALAYQFGEQDRSSLSKQLANGWVDRVGNELHEKLNSCAVLTRCKTGVEFGSSSGGGYDAELEPSYALDSSVLERKRASIDSWVHSIKRE